MAGILMAWNSSKVRRKEGKSSFAYISSSGGSDSEGIMIAGIFDEDYYFWGRLIILRMLSKSEAFLLVGVLSPGYNLKVFFSSFLALTLASTY